MISASRSPPRRRSSEGPKTVHNSVNADSTSVPMANGQTNQKRPRAVDERVTESNTSTYFRSHPPDGAEIQTHPGPTTQKHENREEE